MMLSEGNTTEFETLKTASTETYLLKLENYCEKIYQHQQQLEELKRKK